MKKYVLVCVLLSAGFIETSMSQKAMKLPSGQTGKSSAQIDANRLNAWIKSNADNFNDPVTSNAGLEFPKGSGLRACFRAVPYVAAQYNGDTADIRTAANPNVSGSRAEFQPGYILSPGNASTDATSIYKISAGDSAATNPDYADWPVTLGAPVNALQQPLITGAQSLWSVANDLKTPRYYSAQPLGCELQQYVYAFNKPSPQTTLDTALNHAVFLRWRFINKSTAPWKDAYFGVYADVDLGMSGVDLVGTDSTLRTAYIYNGNGNDMGGYGTTPPATGFAVMESRKNRTAEVDVAALVRVTKNGIYFGIPESDPSQGDAKWLYNVLRGLNKEGNPMIGKPSGSRFAFPGNPELPPNAATNLIEDTSLVGFSARAGDKRLMASVGPVSVAAGDTIEVTFASVVGQGINHRNSVSVLKRYTAALQAAWSSIRPAESPYNPPLPLPTAFVLLQNYPNPFNPVTAIRYDLPAASAVSLKVFDVLGREVQTLVDARQESGRYDVRFDGSRFASGVYFYRLKAGDAVVTRKMMLLK